MVLNKMIWLAFSVTITLANMTQCLIDFGNIATSISKSYSTDLTDYEKMYAYSGKSLNQLGRFDDCNDISIARYAMIQFSEEPVVLLGICGPISCTVSDYYDLINSIINSTVDPITILSSNVINAYTSSSDNLLNI